MHRCDTYYFTYKSEQLGYHSQIILSGRKINDYMRKYVENNIIKQMIISEKQIKGSRIAILGMTLKKSCRCKKHKYLDRD